MLVELIYFAADSNATLEEKLGTLADVTVRHGEDRRGFLTQLAQAVSQSKIVLTIGSVSNLISALSRGLGLPLEKVDWSQFGINNDNDTSLPKGALPLILGRSIHGMILESGDQCIIAADSDLAAVDRLFDTYIAPYLQALAPSDEAFVVTQEPEEEEQTVGPTDEEITEEVAEEPEITIEEAPSESINEANDEYDVFAEVENADVDFMFDKPKRKKRAWIVVLCVLLALLIAGGAGWYFILRDGIGEEYYAELMEAYGDTGKADQLPDEFNNLYLTRFGALYLQNEDVIGTVTLPFSKDALPIVTSAEKGEDYYALRRYDRQFALYGTPYTAYAYDENNANPNLVVNGGKMFASLSKLLDQANASRQYSLTTDSILYGEDEWEVFSAMQPESIEGAEYVSNFADMTSEQRVAAVKKALSLSKVDFGFTESDFDNVGLSTNFLTLIGNDNGKTVVIMARRVSDASFDIGEPVEDDTTDAEGDEATTDETGSEAADAQENNTDEEE